MSILQHSLCVLLVFLLQLSSLQLPSLGYNVPDNYFINCGSDSNVKESGKVYVGESNPVARFSRSERESNESQVSSLLYQTARIFRRESWYEFRIDTNGTYLLRLHFFSFSTRTHLYSARFNVSVPGFWLLQNFHARNHTENNSAPVKEFFMQITPPTFRITFRPLLSSFAFVNAIELFVLPLHLISNDVSRFTYTGITPALSSYSEGLYSRVLETKHRLNVGGQTVNDVACKSPCTRKNSDIVGLAATEYISLCYSHECKPVQFTEHKMGSFGIVYHRILINGLRMPKQRSETESGQGLPEVQDEILAVQKFHHLHLVEDFRVLLVL
ncbi:putative receptor-like protein kinase, partial [Mucuna pruriens]